MDEKTEKWWNLMFEWAYGMEFKGLGSCEIAERQASGGLLALLRRERLKGEE